MHPRIVLLDRCTLSEGVIDCNTYHKALYEITSFNGKCWSPTSTTCSNLTRVVFSLGFGLLCGFRSLFYIVSTFLYMLI